MSDCRMFSNLEVAPDTKSEMYLLDRKLSYQAKFAK